MKSQHYSTVLTLSPENNQRLFNLCGKLNEHLHLIEHRLQVTIKQRGYTFSISGAADQAVQQASRILNGLYDKTEHNILAPASIHLYLQAAIYPTFDDQVLHVHTPQTLISAYSQNQQQYIQRMMQYDMNFGLGPAGTGKTYLAVACAVQALMANTVSRIVLVRPIVEAGERLGFLPGDIAEKINPYLRPLYDALYDMIGHDTVARYIERNIIELAPLAYMRGRSLNDAFIILDEAQNTTIEQMKMFLTRIGFNSKVVITGDLMQTDLNHREDSGLSHACHVLAKIPAIHFTEFHITDIIRHPLVQAIVEAYANDNMTHRETHNHPAHHNTSSVTNK